jgi:hypothetical protein
MAPRVKVRHEMGDPAQEREDGVVTQQKRAAVGRFWLQVDRQTKRSFATAGAAETAGRVIKKGHPLVQVSVYDSVESVSTPVEFPVHSEPAAI